MLNFISTAQASQVASPAAASFMSFLPIVAIFVIFYFFVIRPQQKKMKDHKSMVDAIKVGDRVLTAGGILGTVSKVTSDSEIKVLLAPQVEVTVIRSSLSQVYVNNKHSSPSTINTISSKPELMDQSVLAPLNSDTIGQPKVMRENSKSKIIKAPKPTSKILKKEIK